MPNLGAAASVSKKPKSREVSSRFLSPISPSSTDHYGNHKPRSSTDSRSHNKAFRNSGFLRGLWPASSNPISPSSSISKPDNTLADHLGTDRLKDKLEKPYHHEDPFIVNRQRSCKEFRRSVNDNDKKIHNYTAAKENHKAVFGGSMRYTGRFKFAGKSSDSPSLNDDHSHDIMPGRFSVDENSLRRKSRGLSTDSDSQDSESEYSDVCSGDAPAAGKYFPASYMAPTFSSRKQGIEVRSKFMQSLSARRWSPDHHSGVTKQKPVSSDNSNNNSPKILNSKKGGGSWSSSSPGRSSSGSPKGFMKSNKPPSSPSKGKGGVVNILSIGIELLKGKRSNSSSSSVSSPLGPSSGSGLGWGESVHQLRLLHSRLMQWRYCNGRAGAVNRNAIKRAERNFLYVWNGLITLQHSVLQKKLQLQKEKLEMKLNYILHSQIEALEIWGNMERQHISSVSTTKDYMHSVTCRIPLVDGAKVDPQSTSFALSQASDLATSINLMLTTLSPEIEKAIRVLAELAMVVTQEKLLLEECFELFTNIAALEVQERSLQSSIMQLNLLQQHHHSHQQYILAA